MKRYILKRILGFLIVFIGVTVLAFVLSSISNHDPAFTIAKGLTVNPTEEFVESIREEFNLDKPLISRYFSWVGDATQGDFGVAHLNRVPVLDNFAVYLPKTFTLCGLTFVITIVFTLLIGLLCARFRDSVFDHTMRFVTTLGICLPVFWLGYLLLIVFAVSIPIFTVVPASGIKGYILPSLALSIPLICSGTRQFRSQLIAEFNKDYSTCLRSRGLSHFEILRKHTFRNALPPMITLFASYTGSLLAGAAVVESVFSIQGLGNHLVDAIIARDIPTISASTLLISAVFVVFNLLADLINVALCPKTMRRGELS